MNSIVLDKLLCSEFFCCFSVIICMVDYLYHNIILQSVTVLTIIILFWFLSWKFMFVNTSTISHFAIISQQPSPFSSFALVINLQLLVLRVSRFTKINFYSHNFCTCAIEILLQQYFCSHHIILLFQLLKSFRQT